MNDSAFTSATTKFISEEFNSYFRVTDLLEKVEISTCERPSIFEYEASYSENCIDVTVKKRVH